MGRPEVVFLSETKADVNRMEFVKNSIKFDNKCVVEAKDSAGDLCIMWKNGLSMDVVEFGKNLIAIKVTDQWMDWLMVRFYGPPYFQKKKKALDNFFALLESH